MFKVKYLPLLLAIIAPLIAEEATLPPSFIDILGKHSYWFNEFSNITTFNVKVEDVSTKSIEDSDRRESLDESQPGAKSSESIDHSELIEPSVHIEKLIHHEFQRENFRLYWIEIFVVLKLLMTWTVKVLRILK